jgi:hypothetical protein
VAEAEVLPQDLRAQGDAPVLPPHGVVALLDLRQREPPGGAERARPLAVGALHVASQEVRRGVDAEEARGEEVLSRAAFEDVPTGEPALGEPLVERPPAEDEPLRPGLEAVPGREHHDHLALLEPAPVEDEAPWELEGECEIVEAHHEVVAGEHERAGPARVHEHR